MCGFLRNLKLFTSQLKHPASSLGGVVVEIYYKQQGIVSDKFSDSKHQCVIFSTEFKFIDWCQVD